MTYHSSLQALADPTRRAVFEALRDNPRPVGQLAEDLPVTRPAVSQHLKILKKAGLVSERQQGTRRIYSVKTNGLVELRRYLDTFWDETLESFKSHAESRSEQNEQD